jgi:hypothetical protein
MKGWLKDWGQPVSSGSSAEHGDGHALRSPMERTLTRKNSHETSSTQTKEISEMRSLLTQV